MMTYVIFIGDMLVMAFMIAVVVWVSVVASPDEIERTSRIPLDDEDADG